MEDKKETVNTLPIRAYLDQTVVPLCLEALTELVKAKPDNPL